MTLEQESHDDAISVWSFCLRVTLKDHVFGNPKEKSNTYQSFFHILIGSHRNFMYTNKNRYIKVRNADSQTSLGGWR